MNAQPQQIIFAESDEQERKRASARKEAMVSRDLKERKNGVEN
jgi:hypothetical protein